MRAQEFLVEYRQGLLKYLKQQFPNWPDYVVYDWLVKGAKNYTDQAEMQNWLAGIQKDYGQTRWTLQQLPITLAIFDPLTQQRILSRKGGTANPLQVPNDAERHAQQQQMIKQQGISKEPIIVAKTAQGYELIEGWHRTIQHLQAYPEGYTGPAWVGIK